MSEMRIQRYDESYGDAWNRFIDRSRNGTFIFNRNYMDYHADRFPDFSWVFLKKEKICAVLPATFKDGLCLSHSGLTYGGLVVASDVGLSDVFSCFRLLNDELKRLGASKCVYKVVPYIYHKYPSQEDIYVLFRLNASLIGRGMSSTISTRNRIPFTESRKSGLRKAAKRRIEVRESEDFGGFWDILGDNLLRNYKKSPVHSVGEIRLLKSRFSNNIKLFGAFGAAAMVAGTVVFEMGNVIHVQYMAASEEGKAAGALDAIFETLINGEYKDAMYFDFGVSTENLGSFLNERLLFQKEGFGARGVTYDTYEYLL